MDWFNELVNSADLPRLRPGAAVDGHRRHQLPDPDRAEHRDLAALPDRRCRLRQAASPGPGDDGFSASPTGSFLVFAFSCACVVVELFLNWTGYFTWEYWWWNTPFVPLIIVFGYMTFFAIAAWIYDMGRRPPPPAAGWSAGWRRSTSPSALGGARRLALSALVFRLAGAQGSGLDEARNYRRGPQLSELRGGFRNQMILLAGAGAGSRSRRCGSGGSRRDRPRRGLRPSWLWRRRAVAATKKVNPGGAAPLAVGDSVMLLALHDLAGVGYRHQRAGLSVLCRGSRGGRRTRRAAQLPRLVVLALGTDGRVEHGPDQEGVADRRARAGARPGHRRTSWAGGRASTPA